MTGQILARLTDPAWFGIVEARWLAFAANKVMRLTDPAWFGIVEAAYYASGGGKIWGLTDPAWFGIVEAIRLRLCRCRFSAAHRPRVVRHS